MSVNISFEADHAVLYGVNEAIFLYHMRFWVEQNHAAGRNRHEEKTWTYFTQKELAAQMPFFSEDQVFRIIKKLSDEGVIVKGNFNRSKFDRTIWYSFVNEEDWIRKPFRDSAKSHPAKMQHAKSEDPGPIPDNKPDNKQTTTSPLPPKGPAVVVSSNEKENRETFLSAKEKAPIKTKDLYIYAKGKMVCDAPRGIELSLLMPPEDFTRYLVKAYNLKVEDGQV